MSAVTLYNNDLSPYCRVVRLVANSLGIQLIIKHVNSSAGETKTPQYLKMNPQHTVPTIDDGGFYLGESRAIICYLADTYGGINTLYPKDIKLRAIVNQRLYFDQDLCSKLINYVLPIFYGKEPPTDALEKANDGLDVLEMILKDNSWVAGDHLSVADHALCVTVELPQHAPKNEIDIKKYKNISRWKAQVEAAIPKFKELQDEILKALQKFKENPQ